MRLNGNLIPYLQSVDEQAEEMYFQFPVIYLLPPLLRFSKKNKLLKLRLSLFNFIIINENDKIRT